MGYLFVFLGALFAFAISAVAGGGAGLLMIPLLGILLPATQVPAALSIGTATSAVSRAILFRRDIRWDVACWFVPAALPAAALGAWMLSLAEPVLVEFLLGVFLAANLVFVLRRERPVVASVPSPVLLIALGGCAGFLSGFTGAVGVVFNRLYIRCGLSKNEIVATRGANECLLHLIKIALYAAFGLLDGKALIVGLLVAAAAVFASAGARPLLATVSERLFRRLNYAAMGVAGIATVVTSGATLGARYQVHLTSGVHSGMITAHLELRGSAVAVEWRPGELPQFERTIDVASAPRDVREEAEDMREQGHVGPLRLEEVHSFGGLSYEVRVGDVSRHLVVTD